MAVATIKAGKGASKAKKNLGKALNKLVKATSKPQSNDKAAKRVFTLPVAEVKELKAEARKDGVVNPYRPSSSYAAVVNGLAKLGLGKMHPKAAVVAAVAKEMGSDGLKALKSHKARNKEATQDINGKLWTNTTVVARVDYGAKLNQVGFKVTIEKGTAGLFKVAK